MMGESLRSGARRLAALGLVTGAALLVSVAPSATGTATAATAPKSGGTLTWIWLTGDNNVDLSPDTATGGGGAQWGSTTVERFAIYDALAAFDAEGDVHYRLAESLTSPDGGATWILRLRPNLRFSDGTPFDAAAVEFNWDRAASPTSRSPLASYAQRIASTQRVDARTLRVDLKVPNSQFPRLVAQTGLSYIGSPTAMREEGARFGTEPVGAGAFKVERWQRGNRLSLDRNPQYPLGRPYLDHLVIKYYADETARYNAVRTGGADVVTSQEWNTFTRAKRDKLSSVTTTQNGGLTLMFNTAKRPFNNVEVRRAVAAAIDLDAMDRDLYDGDAELATTLFRKSSPFFTNAQQPVGDAKRAQSLFDGVGGVHFTITVVPSGGLMTLAQWVQARLSAFRGVDVSIATATNAAPFAAGTFDATLLPLPRFGDPYPQMTNYLATGSASNFSRYSNTTFDGALLNGQSSAKVATRRAAYNNAAEQLARDVPVVFLYRVPNQNIFDPKRVGAVPVVNDGLPDFAKVWKR